LVREFDDLATLREAVSAALPEGLPAGWDADQPLVEAGLDSVAVLTLVAELEARCGLQIDESELTAENFSTLNGLAALILRHRAESA
jgi:acyl carrier protein